MAARSARCAAAASPATPATPPRRSLLADGLAAGTLVFGISDVVAIGVMSAVRDAGRGVGADVAVAGFDDIATGRDIRPGLTTVRVPLEDLGSARPARRRRGGVGRRSQPSLRLEVDRARQHAAARLQPCACAPRVRARRGNVS